jgi:hypothetical protein
MLIALSIFYPMLVVMAEENMLIIDDRQAGDFRSTLGSEWRIVTDGVMGGVSQGQLSVDEVEGSPCLRLRGDVNLENNGGFVQAVQDLPQDSLQNVSDYVGVLLQVYGNGEQYNLHLRTHDMWLPWQSYRATFTATNQWQTLRLPFAAFKAHRIRKALDIRQLKRIGLVAIGREFQADLCLGSIAFYK